MANPDTETHKVSALGWGRIAVVFLCFLPGLLYMGVAARRSSLELTSRLYWEYAGRILNRTFVEGFPEVVQHDLGRIEELTLDKAAAAPRPLAPYTEFPSEYPPGALLIFAAVRLPFDGISSFLPAFQFAMGACCAMAAVLVMLAIRRLGGGFPMMVASGIAFSAWTLLEGGNTVNQFDPAATLMLALALFSYSRGRPFWAAAALGIGGSIKLWPMLILPALVLASLATRPWTLRRLAHACLVGATGFMAFGLAHVPIMMMGTSPRDILGYAIYMKDRPLEPSSVPGSLAILWQVISGHVPKTKWSYGGLGVVGPGAVEIQKVFQILFPALYASVLAWMVAKRPDFKRFSNFAALIVCVTLLTSKVYIANYLLWLLPFFLVDLSARQWTSVCLYAGSILAWKVIYWSRQEDLSIGKTSLVLIKNAMMLGLTISYARAVHASGWAHPDSDAPSREPAGREAPAIA
jgi:Glycosyltransferase family 87